jgi:hypothetical protein
VFVPKFWAKSRSAPAGKNGRLSLQTWGWSDVDSADALERAEQRLHALLQRVRNRDDLGRSWQYYSNGERPLREEVLERSPAGATEGAALVTRNRYGVAVLNTARLLAIDVDLPAVTPQKRSVFNWFSKPKPPPETAEARLERLQRDLVANSTATFRVYRTAGGFRALAIDREFDPAGDETLALMQGVGADAMFIKLCRAQKSFRARLTPKPWRCGTSTPPHSFPRSASEDVAFAQWLAAYTSKTMNFATCSYVDTLGSAAALAWFKPLIDFHDRETRALTAIALA